MKLLQQPSKQCALVCVALTAVRGSVWLSCLLVGVVVGVEVEVEVEGLQWPSLPALGRGQGQGGGSSAGLSTHERMLCRWVRTTAHTSHTHTHNMHGAGQASYTVSGMQCLKCPKCNCTFYCTLTSCEFVNTCCLVPWLSDATVNCFCLLKVQCEGFMEIYLQTQKYHNQVFNILIIIIIIFSLLFVPRRNRKFSLLFYFNAAPSNHSVLDLSYICKVPAPLLVHFKHRWKQICKVSFNCWNSHKLSGKSNDHKQKTDMRLYSKLSSN